MAGRKHTMRETGLTLVELLVASAIGLVMLVVVASQLTTGARTTATVSNQQSMLEDLRTAGNYLGDMGALAGYVFPVGAKLTIGASTGYTVRNPATGSNTWTVGTHGILAMLLPPTITGGACNTASPDNNQKVGCVRFLAFYALSRDHVTKNATGAENPGEDPNDTNALALYRYFQYLPSQSLQTYVSNLKTAGTLANTVFTGQSGNLLADYLAPGGFAPTFERCFADGSSLNRFDVTGTKCDAVHSASQVRVNLQSEMTVRGKAVRVPSVPLQFSFATRNTVEP